jgi:hypothetical protein
MICTKLARSLPSIGKNAEFDRITNRIFESRINRDLVKHPDLQIFQSCVATKACVINVLSCDDHDGIMIDQRVPARVKLALSHLIRFFGLTGFAIVPSENE